jgi:glutathione S-transferase
MTLIPALPGSRLTQGLIGLLLVIAILALAYCTGRGDGKNAVNAEISKARIEQAKRELREGNKAAETRAADALAAKDEELEDEKIIASAPGGTVTPADRAVACNRLREAYPGKQLPAGC